ncbi:MAG: beta-ketoacyl-ACP synthase II [Actinobacteria bacterium]|nr:beta-ketoacyl-ACP synthase II [Actinomycetota bacterium]
MTDVVVTGLGVVTPIGTGTESFWEGLMARRSGVRLIGSFDTEGLVVRIGAEVLDFNPADHMPVREVGRSDRYTQMAIAAADFAWAGSHSEGAHDPERCGVIIGSGIGGLATIEKEHGAFMKGGPRRVSPLTVPKMMANAASGAVAMKLGVFGPNYSPVSACATAGHAIGEAFRAIRYGSADVMLAGGSEAALTPFALAAFTRMGALSKRNDEPDRASRPFDADREGFVFGEGAGVLVLESRASAERRGAEIMAELVGYGASADAYHVTQPDPKGLGAERAMGAALSDAGAAPEEVAYINAHGTGTPLNDRIETVAIKNALGTEAKRIPISSTKSQTGHLLGAAGAIEAAAVVLALQKGIIPGPNNLEKPDPECDLDYVPEGPREVMPGLALSNSFGFGGQNSCLAFRPA